MATFHLTQNYPDTSLCGANSGLINIANVIYMNDPKHKTLYSEKNKLCFKCLQLLICEAKIYMKNNK